MCTLTFDDVRSDMVALGTYRPEFDPMIRIYVGLIRQYEDTLERINKTGQLQTKSARAVLRRALW